LVGSIAVANLAFQKTVVARFILDYWKTISEVLAEYDSPVCWKQQADSYDRFNFNIKLADQANLEAKTMFFCVKYTVNGVEYWDNNNSTNFQVDFRNKAKLQNKRKGIQPVSAQLANSLPRSQKKTSLLLQPMLATFDDFAEGFDPKSAVNKITRKLLSPSSQLLSNCYNFGALLSTAIQATNTALGNRSGITLKLSDSVLASRSYNELLDKYCFVYTY
jgi:hypothetical protein